MLSAEFSKLDDGKKIAKKKSVVKQKSNVISNKPHPPLVNPLGGIAPKGFKKRKTVLLKARAARKKGAVGRVNPPEQQRNPRPFLWFCAACALAERGTLGVRRASRPPHWRSNERAFTKFAP